MITLYELKNYLGVDGDDEDNDPLLVRLIRVAENMVRKYLHRNIDKQTYTDEVFVSDGQRKDYCASDYPIDEEETFKIVWDTTEYVSGDDYVLTPSSGRVHFNFYVPRTHRYFQWTYTAGYDIDDVPEDIKQACYEIVQLLFRNRGLSGAVKSKKVGDLSISYASADTRDAIDRILSTIECHMRRWSKL